MPKVSDDHLAARRQQILDAAGRCFARDGFHNTSVHDIVRESGVSAGLVYRYFKGKDDMIVAIVEEWHARRRKALDSSTVDDLKAGYLGLLRTLDKAELRLGIQVWAEAVRQPRIRELTRNGVDEPRKSTAQRVRAAQENGELPADLDPDALSRIFIAIYQGLALQSVLDDDLDAEAFTHTLESLLNRLINRKSFGAGRR